MFSLKDYFQQSISFRSSWRFRAMLQGKQIIFKLFLFYFIEDPGQFWAAIILSTTSQCSMVTYALNTSWVPGKINQWLTMVPRSNLLSAEQKHQNLSSAMKTCTRTQGIKPRWSHNTNISRFKQLFFQVHIHPSQQKKGGRTDLWTSKNPTKAANKQGI